MDTRGFERKYGGTLVWGGKQVPWNFSLIDGGGHEYAFRTRRADLNSLILDRAGELGAVVIEGTPPSRSPSRARSASAM
ncbi:hypothetical protein AB0B79_12550 [Streptomyces sp. NPDC039022]